MVCDKMVEAAEAEEEAGEEAGYRLKNKSPAQRCGEKQSKPRRVNHWLHKPLVFIFLKTPTHCNTGSTKVHITLCLKGTEREIYM